MKKVKYFIIGAGISGLSFANHAEDYLIVEKEAEVGGYCRTIKRGQYVWDYAGHFFHFSTEEFRKKFVDAVPREDIVVQDKCTKIYYRDALIDYPFQMNIHQLEKDEFIDCLYDLFHKTEKEQYDNFLDMLYGKFGNAIVEKFLRPYNEKLYAVDLTKLDVDAMGRFFPYADKEAIISNMKEASNRSYNSSFLYPKNGAFTFIEILAKGIEQERLLLNTEVIGISLDEKTAKLSNGETIQFEYLINTSPLNTFLKMTGRCDFAEDLSYNKVLVFNLGFNHKSRYTDEHWMYIPSKTCNYYRIGFYDNIIGQDKLSMYIEIGYDKDALVTEEEIDRQLEMTLVNLKKQGIIGEDTILEEHMAILMDPAYVHINKAHDEKIKNLFQEWEEKQIYSIGRYGAWTYCSMEDCMVEALKLAERIV